MRKYCIFYYLVLLFLSMIILAGCNKNGDYIDELGKEYKAGFSVDFKAVSAMPDNVNSNEYQCNEYSEISDKVFNFAQEINIKRYDNLTDRVQEEFKKQGYELFTESKENSMKFYDASDIRNMGYEYVRVGNTIAIRDKKSGKLCADCFNVLLSKNYDFMDIVKKYGFTALAEQIKKADEIMLSQIETGIINNNDCIFEFYGQIIEYNQSGLVIQKSEYRDQGFEPYYVLKGLDYLFDYYADDVWSIRNVTDQEKGSIMDVLSMYSSVQINNQTYDKNLHIYGKDNRIYELIVSGSVADSDEPLLGVGETDTFRNLLVGMGNSASEADNFIKNNISKVKAGSGRTGNLSYIITTDSLIANRTSFELKVFVTK